MKVTLDQKLWLNVQFEVEVSDDPSERELIYGMLKRSLDVLTESMDLSAEFIDGFNEGAQEHGLAVRVLTSSLEEEGGPDVTTSTVDCLEDFLAGE